MIPSKRSARLLVATLLLLLWTGLPGGSPAASGKPGTGRSAGTDRKPAATSAKTAGKDGRLTEKGFLDWIEGKLKAGKVPYSGRWRTPAGLYGVTIRSPEGEVKVRLNFAFDTWYRGFPEHLSRIYRTYFGGYSAAVRPLWLRPLAPIRRRILPILRPVVLVSEAPIVKILRRLQKTNPKKARQVAKLAGVKAEPPPCPTDCPVTWKPVEDKGRPRYFMSLFQLQTGGRKTRITQAALAGWGLETEGLVSIAVANLARLTNSRRMRLVRLSGQTGMLAFRSGDGYDGARILLPDLPARVRRHVKGGSYAVGAPHRNLLLITSDKDSDRIRRLAKLTKRSYFGARAEDRLSPDLFRLGPKGKLSYWFPRKKKGKKG